MAVGMYLAFILFIQFCSIPVCYGNEPVDIQSVNIKLLELENEILRLKATVCGRDHELEDIARLRESSLQSEATVAELRKDLQELTQRTRTPNVAFRSVLSTTIGPMVKGQIIVFDQVGLNTGDGYNRHTGIFTVPYNGTYIFSMTLGNPQGKPGVFYMVHSDGSKQTALEYVFGGHTSGWDMGGVTTVAYVSAGDSVWVTGDGYASGVSPTDRYHTGFSGILVNKQ